MNQIDRCPVLMFCHTRSGLLSALKSAMAAILQAGATLGSSANVPPQVLPVMNQIDRSPVVVFCQTRSGLPSLLKSPAPAIDQATATFGSRAKLLPSHVTLFMNQMERSPVEVFCHTMSLLPS